ncbi:DUF3616 domain-containing protein [Rhodocytophaga aerolata]|uniref:DUF3616 domain-containing protein n=1 Tax=Rhodocytophaga aerolata TaxID=455078 RepID=A0ABT8RHP6_9BACT|nr:DUF3616 domain-containing protein [Rhodocytophaga aerolata]MDO1451627.1 DUF3616 domain-containing protein [Rhodocytophaga aerolata]
MFTKPILLQFDDKVKNYSKGKDVRDGLSSVERCGDYLWMACDESIGLERVKIDENGNFSQHQAFSLLDYLQLPAGDGCEIDIEGMCFHGHYLWLVGSHSLKRKKPKQESADVEKQLQKLAKVEADANRYILARIPLLPNPQTGEYRLCKSCVHPTQPETVLTAAQLIGWEETNQLMQVLKEDIHFKAFMHIPGKDNGFDIEGLAIKGEKLYIGLRGPVLRGWAAILEVEVVDTADGYFALKEQADGKLYKKHFLHLGGMGIRELAILKEDLLILAGPTMDLDGEIAVFRWKNGLHQQKEALVGKEELEKLFTVPHGFDSNSGKDKAEGMTIFDQRHLLIVYDSPAESRKIANNVVVADLYKL